MTISKKLFVTLFIALLSVLLVGSYGLWQLGQAQDRFQYVVVNTFPSLDAMSTARTSLAAMRIGVRDLLLAETPAQREDAKGKIQAAENKFDAAMADYLANDISNDADRQLLDADKAAEGPYKAALDKIIALSDAGNHEGAIAVMHQAAPQTALAAKALDDHYKFNTDLANQLAQQNQSSYELARWLALASIAAAFIVTGILSAQLYRTIKNGLEQIRSNLTNVSESLDFRHRLAVRGNDEISDATRALNQLLDKLQTSFQTLRGIAQQVGGASRELSETASQVSSAAGTQSEASANMAATIEEMTVSINHVAEQAKATHDGAVESKQLVASGSAIIRKTIDDIHEISSVVKQSASSIQQLETDSSQVGAVINVIREIADQTNLLALNAAIEAARAGEQGRGFAVVADEVRKLAERTARSTQEISATIGTMMSRSKDTASQMGAAENLVETGVQRADEANQAIAQIGSNATAAAENISAITAAIQQQGVASNNIAIQVEQTAQMSEESSAAAQHAASGATRLDQLVKQQMETLEQFQV
jgi:methyl-accepting chemotaxis protein